MNNNIRIARELVRIAKMIAAESKTEEYFSNVRKYIDECFSMNYVVGSFDIKYNVRYDTDDRNFKLTIIQGARNVPSTEDINEDTIKDMYNDAVREVKANYDKIDGYDALSENEKEKCLDLINENCLVNITSVCIKFFNANGSDSGIRQELSPDNFDICE